MTRRPSERRPVDLPKKERPLGGLTGNPSPAASPPVSAFESPKLKITGGSSHPPLTPFRNCNPRISTTSRASKEREKQLFLSLIFFISSTIHSDFLLLFFFFLGCL
uniref:Uncharacterized protein n=1 Tax=Opuntia streptacantha TaxID=393608 RepID=A0A7C8ZGM1_OPUST